MESGNEHEVKCPKCNSVDVIPIVYGSPNAEMAEKRDRHELFLGGCILHCNQPTHYCNTCKSRWRDNRQPWPQIDQGGYFAEYHQCPGGVMYISELRGREEQERALAVEAEKSNSFSYKFYE